MNDYKLPQGFIDLVEHRYDLKVIDSHYVLVDEKFNTYNMMLDVQFNEKMKETFLRIYAKKDSAMYVDWEIREKTNSIRFLAEIGNNILLLWDSLIEE